MKNLQTRTFRIAAFAVIVFAVATSTTACVDEEFRIDEVSTDITIASEDLTIPLGFLKDKTLGEIIGDNADLDIDAEGNYAISFEDGSTFVIDGLQGSSSLDKSVASASFDFPEVNFSDNTFNYNDVIGIEVPEILKSITSLPISQEVSKTEDCQSNIQFDINVPNRIKSIESVEFVGEPGAYIDLNFNLNGLAPINGGGTVTVTTTIPEGMVFYGEDKKEITTGEYANTKTISAGESSKSFGLYLHSVNTASTEISANKLPIDKHLDLKITYTLTAKSGITFNPGSAPTITVNSVFEYADATVIVDEIVIDSHEQTLDERITVNNIIDEVKSVSKIQFTDTSLPIRIEKLDWVDNTLADAIKTDIVIPANIKIAGATGANFDAATNTVSASLTQMRKGFSIGVESVTLDEDKRTPDNGKITIEFPLTVNIGAVPEGLRLQASKLQHTGSADMDIVIDKTTLNIESVQCRVDYSHSEIASIDLGDLSDLGGTGISVDNFDLSPVIAINIQNPIGIPVNATVSLVPVVDNKDVTENKVVVNDIVIAPATRENGVTKPSENSIVVAKADRQSDFPNCQFKAADITRLFEGEIPQSVRVEIAIASDSSQEYAIYTDSSYTISYDYSINVPFEFGKDFQISYSDTADGLSGTFDEVADYISSVNDIRIIATVGNSTPLNLKIEAELLDTAGQPTKTKAVVEDGYDTVRGSADGSVCESDIRIALQLNDDFPTALKEIDGVRFTLTAFSTTDGAKLNKEQTLSAKLKLNIRGGVDLSLDDLLNGNKEE